MAKKTFISLMLASMILALLASGLFKAEEVKAASYIYNENGTYTVPDDVFSIIVETWGAGGAGGGSTNAGPFSARDGAGGGGGAYARSMLSVTPGQVFQVVIGTGGVGVSGGNGGNGTPSFAGPDTNPVNAIVLAAAGSGGTANTAGGNPAGGAGGLIANSIGDTKIAGENGGPGGTCFTSCSGKGGDGALGGAGGAGLCGPYVTASGNPGEVPGGGGGGGRTSQYNGARRGGHGANGRVVITEILPVEYSLLISSTDGGSVIEPGEGNYGPYNGGTVVHLEAEAEFGHQFVNWTGNDTENIANTNAAVTTITMLGDYSIIANFELARYSLMIQSELGGSVTAAIGAAETEVGRGETVTIENIPHGTVVNLEAAPGFDYLFNSWDGSTENIADVNAAITTITMEGNYVIVAKFDLSGISCGKNPILNVTPASHLGSPGDERIYIVSVKNNDDAACNDSAFYFLEDNPFHNYPATSCPADWTCGRDTIGLVYISPQEEIEIEVSLTSSLASSPGDTYDFEFWLNKWYGEEPETGHHVGFDYIVVEPIAISSFTSGFPNECAQSRIPTFYWGVNTAEPYDYQFRICSNFNCTGASDPLIFRSGSNDVAWAPACSLCCNQAPYNNINFGGFTYHGQVKVRYAGTGEAGWSAWESLAFTTYNNCWPSPDFGWTPKLVTVGQPVEFTDRSVPYDAAIAGWFWRFENGNPATRDTQNPTTTFEVVKKGTRVDLEVWDDNNYHCPTHKNIDVSLPLPDYRPVAPIGRLDNFLARLINIFTRF